MAITRQQWAPVTQNEIAKFAMMGSRGELEVNPIAIDDDGIDLQIRRRGRVNPSLAIQVKSSHTLLRDGRAYKLRKVFATRPERVRSNRAYWYAIVYFDRRLPGARDVFLIPSTVLHRRAPRSVSQDKIVFHFVASLSLTSRDQWSEFKVPYDQVGRKILAILRELERR